MAAQVTTSRRTSFGSMIAGIVIVVLILLAILLALCMFFRRRRRIRAYMEQHGAGYGPTSATPYGNQNTGFSGRFGGFGGNKPGEAYGGQYGPGNTTGTGPGYQNQFAPPPGPPPPAYNQTAPQQNTGQGFAGGFKHGA